jgi:AcrR family transcriptional regulator
VTITTEERRPYKKVARERSQERTRDALLDTAIDEFYGNRWQRTSLEALAMKAGVSKQTLLRHFGSKDGLLLKALMRGASQVVDQRWNVEAGDVAGAVENLQDHYEEWGERSLRVGAWLHGPMFLNTLSQVARQVHYGWVEHAFSPWLDELEEPERARLRATLIALCDVHTWWLFKHDLKLEREEIHAILVNAIERVLP